MLGALEQARERERRFVADASHELRTPLTALRGNAEHIARHGADPEALDDLAVGAARLSSLIEDLLVLAREDAAAAPSATRLELAEIARRVAADEPQVELEVVGDTSVEGDPDALERALANLVENARIHGPQGGRIHVTVEAHDGVVELGVRDEGPGLSSADAERAVQRFWRGESAGSRPGSGLGLAIVRATAERHRGSLVVDGSRFTLRAARRVRRARGGSRPAGVARARRRAPPHRRRGSATPSAARARRSRRGRRGSRARGVPGGRCRSGRA